MPDTPIILKSLEDEGEKLRRVELQRNDDRNERWLQDLIFRHANLLPVEVFDEVFAPPIPLAQELPAGGNSVDNVYVSPQGRLTLVETKLWKNPEKHRTVVAQIIEYASHLATWNLDQLIDAVERSSGPPGKKTLEDRIRPHVAGECVLRQVLCHGENRFFVFGFARSV